MGQARLWPRRHPYASAFALLFALYLSWLAFDWLPASRQLVGDLALMAAALAAAAAAWGASRRSAASRRLQIAWRWAAIALASQTAGGAAQLAYRYLLDGIPYPSLADLFYVSFYPLMLIAVLCFPAARLTRRQALELALDCAVVALGGGSLFVYFVLGPDAVTSDAPLQTFTSLAYPIGGMVLLVGLATVLLRNPVRSTIAIRGGLAAGMALFIAGDLIYGYVSLHGGYQGGDPIDLIYIVAFVCFGFAAARQPRVQEADTDVGPADDFGARIGWLPYLAVAACLAVLLGQESSERAFPDFVVALIAAAVTCVVVVRQILALGSVRQSGGRLAEAQAIAQIGSWDWDLQRDKLERSAEELRLYGLDPAAPPSTYAEWMRAVHPDDRARVERIVSDAVETATPFTCEFRIVRPDGEVRTLLARADVKTRGERVVRMHGTHQDVTDRKRMERKLQHQADHDPLTGLPNRRRFAEELDRLLRYAARYERGGAIVMLDLDDFKYVNDAFGHAAGDAALKLAAQTLKARVRETDLVARLGGDEFALVLPEADAAEALRVATDLRDALAAAAIDPPLHGSFGVALFDGSRQLMADDVLVAADIALYDAKAAGKDRVHVHDGRVSPALTWVDRIRRALDEDRFVLYAQPMIDVDSKRVTHYELLVRMLSDDGDVVPPDAFLPTAERFGLVVDIDRWVTREGLALARRGERVSINLCASSIGDEQILASVRQAIADGVTPDNVVFEFTETAAMSNMEAARAFAQTLDELGCGVALDDFGSGFGSFNYLKQLPTRYLKIDAEFIRDVVANQTDQEVVRSITEVAHSLGKQTIAEGVEDQATLDALGSFNVDRAQGFHIGRPQRITAPTRFERELAERDGAVSPARAGRPSPRRAQAPR
jgi:diguanylate cyclase (GGDEF)-like protein